MRDAVLAGSPAAEYDLAQRLFDGRGLDQNQAAAASWFDRAASAGFAPAAFRLGAFYQKGVGVQRDPAAAKRWYTAAARAGNARAAHNLGVMEAEPADEKADYAEAARLVRKAGQMGVRDSQYNLAVLYARGLGVERDLGQAWLWFSLAAAQGDPEAARKRDEVAAKMDPAGLAAAADLLSRFKAVAPDPAANDAAPTPGPAATRRRRRPLARGAGRPSAVAGPSLASVTITAMSGVFTPLSCRSSGRPGRSNFTLLRAPAQPGTPEKAFGWRNAPLSTTSIQPWRRGHLVQAGLRRGGEGEVASEDPVLRLALGRAQAAPHPRRREPQRRRRLVAEGAAIGEHGLRVGDERRPLLVERPAQASQPCGSSAPATPGAAEPAPRPERDARASLRGDRRRRRLQRLGFRPVQKADRRLQLRVLGLVRRHVGVGPLLLPRRSSDGRAARLRRGSPPCP